MEWFDLRDETGEPNGVLELPATWTPPGYAMELHVLASTGFRAFFCWMLEDGTYLAEAKVGQA